ncbi:MAG: RNA polymerase sigma factor [Leptonema sp. (in: bacteria)]
MKEKEIETLIKNTKKLVLSVIKKYLDSDGYAYIDDIVQETYIRLILAIKKGQFQNKSKMTTYLYQIAKNETIKINKKLEKEKIKQEKYLEKMPKDFTQRSILSVENLLYEYEALHNEFNPKQKQIFLLYVCGYQLKEIAKKLNLQLGTVKSNLFRIKAKIRKQFK